MQRKPTSLISWCNTYSDQLNYLEALKHQRWPNGFECPRSSDDYSHELKNHHILN